MRCLSYMRTKFLNHLATLVAVFILSVHNSSAQNKSIVFETDEAETALSILDSLARGESVEIDAWNKLYKTDGYLRLKEREHSMKREFEDDSFRAFLTADEIRSKRQTLRQTLAAWCTADLSQSRKLALRYLPPKTTIRATVYPVIKPKTNSFVFDLERNPAIFLYLDPEITPDKMSNTIAHELHHVGFFNACTESEAEKSLSALSESKREAVRWLGAFGEGLAMLAAAGSPKVHPHRFSKPEERERWDNDIERFDSDLALVEAFLTDVALGKISEEQVTERAMYFYGVQGPWYTVGYKMAATIETRFGKRKLVSVI
ncbi:MAG: DUF5700 domain-containing putative Zn-dependent protease [Pyrinomonadaceae bacterium]